ncbi:MAG: hypothetical protein R2845_15745 [Thermomicrobiales bacterium]
MKRRCLYFWIDFPTFTKEYQILSAKMPEASDTLRTQICTFTQGLREIDLFKNPGMAETLDWANALLCLGTTQLTNNAVDDTLASFLTRKMSIGFGGDIAANLANRARGSNTNPGPRGGGCSSAAANLLTLGRDMRDAGLNIGSGQVLSLVEAVATVDARRKDDLPRGGETGRSSIGLIRSRSSTRCSISSGPRCRTRLRRSSIRFPIRAWINRRPSRVKPSRARRANRPSRSRVKRRKTP